MTDSAVSWGLGTVASVTPVADGVVAVDIYIDTQTRHATPGAHVDVRVDDGTVRSYSVVSSGEGGRSITVAVRLSPTSRGGSRFMHALVPGDRLEISAPIQNFPLRVGAPRYLLLAGGIGITAIAAMATTLRRVGAEYRLLHVGRSRAAMPFVSELIAAHGDRLSLHVDAEGTGLNISDLVDSVEPTTELYMCGPVRMMDAVRRAWTGRDLPPADLRYETFGNSGWFDVEPFRVVVPRLGIETTVGVGESMLDALERAGADMMYDCRKGECGLCQVDIIHVDGKVDHRDVFFSESQKRTCTKVCTCVSRVANAGDTGILALDIP
ncbi:PDR/VanB family oxidoreductase [Rhodococcus sp. IEGM 1330]|uniref:PDR/VanB family oxidoreductase n=1 Tax=Rhodococcus sp. IEGM 1330 TaxID=3082225 RepID=UPI002953A6DB|nr:PDR/VanB family oxidoreductase [Rhodococcus sp. IEGM 1330]MDV8022717.1 PDR/VanB family oxidoreductase [Rhodococcus sp. IEGM 1330]